MWIVCNFFSLSNVSSFISADQFGEAWSSKEAILFLCLMTFTILLMERRVAIVRSVINWEKVSLYTYIPIWAVEILLQSCALLNISCLIRWSAYVTLSPAVGVHRLTKESAMAIFKAVSYVRLHYLKDWPKSLYTLFSVCNLFFNRFHLKQHSKATKTQKIIGCERIRNVKLY